MASVAVILAAAGKSSRFADRNYKKPFAPLAGKPVWLYSAEKFLARSDVKQVIVVIDPGDREEFLSKFGANIAILGIDVVDGGAERADSVGRGLAKVRPELQWVCVHDAARPCLVEAWIDNLFAAGQASGAAILATPLTATLKKVSPDRQIVETVDRSHLWEAQTPQLFRRDLLVKAHAERGDRVATDDAQLVEWLGQPVTVVPGSPLNLKITTKDDLRLAEQVLKALPKPKLAGPGHPFANDDMWR